MLASAVAVAARTTASEHRALQASGSSIAVGHVDQYLDDLRPVLQPGVEPRLRQFLRASADGQPPFTIALEFACLGIQGMSPARDARLPRDGTWNDPAIMCDAQKLPKANVWFGDQAWRQKYMAEALIPMLVERSVWHHQGNGSLPSLTIPVFYSVCFGLDVWVPCYRKFASDAVASSRPAMETAFVMTDDHGACLSMRKLADRYTDEDSEQYEYDDVWDADKIYGCVCDYPYVG